MQKLHLVGFTTDHKSLILSVRRGARSGGFMLDIDADLGTAVQDAIERALAAAETDDGEEAIEPIGPSRPESALSVRELQARLRSGRTLESVAAEAGVDVEWVTRFAAPVLAEQARVIERTRNATYSRARLGPSALRLGPSVYRNLASKGIELLPEELDRDWSTRQLADGRWVVTFTYVSRGRRQKPQWELDMRTGEVTPRDRLAGELAHVPGGPRPASPAAAPTKPAKVPAASLPTDLDRANAKRVAEARKAAEAQLADAAKRGSKRSAEVAKRAQTPQAAADRARRRAAAVAAAELAAESAAEVEAEESAAAEADVDVVPAAPVLITAEDVGPERMGRSMARRAGGVPGKDAAPRASTSEVEAEDAARDAIRPASRGHALPLGSSASIPPSDDPGASAVAMVREAAQALLSDFAAGTLADDPVPTWAGVTDADREDEVAEAEAAEAAADEAWAVDVAWADGAGTSAADVAGTIAAVEEPPSMPAPAVSPVPSRRRPVVQAQPVTPPPTDVGAEPRRLRIRREEKVVRTPIDLDTVVAPKPVPPTGPAFRDDLAALARQNGAVADEVVVDDRPVADPAPSVAPRRRRSEPLRAR